MLLTARDEGILLLVWQRRKLKFKGVKQRTPEGSRSEPGWSRVPIRAGWLPKAPFPLPGAPRRGRHSSEGQSDRRLLLFQHQCSYMPVDECRACRLNYLLDLDAACRSQETFTHFTRENSGAWRGETRLHDPLFADGVLRPGVAD